jgi:hypothetical protein
MSAVLGFMLILPNGMLRGKPHQPDGQHPTPEGYHMLAEDLPVRWPARRGADWPAAFQSLQCPLLPSRKAQLTVCAAAFVYYMVMMVILVI